MHPVHHLSAEQRSAVLVAAAELLGAHVETRMSRLEDPSLNGAAGILVSGVFVSVKRAGQLRSCCGIQGVIQPLLEALRHACRNTACHDARFPPISRSELRFLGMQVWLLHSPRRMAERGEARVGAVQVGLHGLQIALDGKRGLLLPGVAVDARWDARTFLRQVCVKAGLPPEAWEDDRSHISLFEGHCLEGSVGDWLPADSNDAATPASPALDASRLRMLAGYARDRLRAHATGSVMRYEPAGFPERPVQGMMLALRRAGEPPMTSRAQIVPKQGFGLLAGLETLLQETMSRTRLPAEESFWTGLEVELLVLDDTALHGTASAPDLRGFTPGQRALLGLEGGRFALVHDPDLGPEAALQDVVRQASGNRDHLRLHSFRAVSTGTAMRLDNAPVPVVIDSVREPAVAGKFYPAALVELDAQVDRNVATIDGPRESWPAAMVPHAALRFSGDVAARTLGRLDIPRTILVFCPRHTGAGVDAAVAPHAGWKIPGGTVASDPVLARELANRVPGFQLDAAAHGKEHAIEVQLPLLRKLAPDSRVIGIAVGRLDLSRCLEMGADLARFLEGLEEQPLLLISGDMNHFADDTENRRRDELALRAMETLDPTLLHEVVRNNDISMCGLLPSVIVMEALRQRGMLKKATRSGYATTADTTGDRSRVVGYAGMLLGHEPAGAR